MTKTNGFAVKTENRTAQVGERILITNVHEAEDRYVNGDIGVVVGAGDSSAVLANINGHDRALIFNVEYEVIVSETSDGGVLEKMQAEIEELKAKVAKLEGSHRQAYIKEVIAKLPRVKTAQEVRDEIVEKAKADVKELREEIGRYGVRAESGNHTYEHKVLTFTFSTNVEKRVVTALVRGKNSEDLYEVGIAKCAPDDCFNSHIGKAIALRRALGLKVPAEYLTAPQPTEVRVGDTTQFGKVFAVRPTHRTVGDGAGFEFRTADKGYTVIRPDGYELWVELSDARIIDDSREEASE